MRPGRRATVTVPALGASLSARLLRVVPDPVQTVGGVSYGVLFNPVEALSAGVARDERRRHLGSVSGPGAPTSAGQGPHGGDGQVRSGWVAARTGGSGGGNVHPVAVDVGPDTVHGPHRLGGSHGGPVGLELTPASTVTFGLARLACAAASFTKSTYAPLERSRLWAWMSTTSATLAACAARPSSR